MEWSGPAILHMNMYSYNTKWGHIITHCSACKVRQSWVAIAMICKHCHDWTPSAACLQAINLSTVPWMCSTYNVMDMLTCSNLLDSYCTAWRKQSTATVCTQEAKASRQTVSQAFDNYQAATSQLRTYVRTYVAKTLRRCQMQCEM